MIEWVGTILDGNFSELEGRWPYFYRIIFSKAAIFLTGAGESAPFCEGERQARAPFIRLWSWIGESALFARVDLDLDDDVRDAGLSPPLGCDPAREENQLPSVRRRPWRRRSLRVTLGVLTTVSICKAS
uniref:Uncharacterized protein n=1 Tax=Cannabis sativa TaxID=3483 RepID=A0A803Q0D9_CANSA